MIKFLKRKRNKPVQEVASDQPELSLTDQIGATAGQIWGILAENGETNLTQLVKKTDASRDLVMQALGWLARENKIQIAAQQRVRLVSLVSEDHCRAA